MFTKKKPRFADDYIRIMLKEMRTRRELSVKFGITDPEFIEVNFQVEEVSNESESNN